MEQKIRDWYAERHYQPHMMISVGKTWGFSQAQVESSMIHCYNKIVNEDKLIHDVDIARYVRNVCKDIDTEVHSQELEVLYNSNSLLKDYKLTIGGVCIALVLIHGLLVLYYSTLV